MDFTEKTVKKNYVFQGKIMSVRRDDICLWDGTPAFREIVEHSGGAAVFYEENGKILFVEQYRYAYGEKVLEIPAGKLERGEDPKLAALRELEEEAGLKATDAELSFVLYPSPGYTNEKIYIYRVKSAQKGQACPDDGELLSVVWIGEDEAKKRLLAGEFHDAKTIAALQRYFLEE